MTQELPNPPSLSLIRDYIAALQTRDQQAMLDLCASDFALDWVHNDVFADRPLTHEKANQFWAAWFAAFAEMDFEVTRTIAAESVVVAQWIFTGTHTGPLGPPVFDPPENPTDKTIRLRGISVYDIAGDLIHKETMYIDLATLYVELGVNR